MSFVKLHVEGPLGADPVLRYTTGGKPICEFAVAHNTRKKGDPKNKCIWFNCVTFDANAEWVAENFRKGNVIRIANATPDRDEWTGRDGQKHTKDKWLVWEFVGETQSDDTPPPDDDGPLY